LGLNFEPIYGFEGLLEPQAHRTNPQWPLPPDDPGHDRTRSPLDEVWGEFAELIHFGRTRARDHPVFWVIDNQPYYELLDNLVLMMFYTGRPNEVLAKRAKIKRWTLQTRRLHNLQGQSMEV